MHRRHFLALPVGSALLGGCVGPLVRRTRHRVELVGRDAVPAEHDVAVAVGLTDATVAPESPATLEVLVTNEGPRRRIYPGAGGCAPFNRAGGESDPPGLWLYLAGQTPERRDGRWTADAPADRPRGFPAYGCLGREYAPGETVRTAYELWDDYAVEGYYPAGTYRWETQVGIYPPDGETDEPTAEFRWGFDVRVGPA